MIKVVHNSWCMYVYLTHVHTYYTIFIFTVVGSKVMVMFILL